MILRFISNFITLFLRFLTKRLPRDKKKWLISASVSFRDNPKYLYYQILENHPEINIIWLSHDKTTTNYLNSKGLPACTRYSLKGLYHSITAGVYISDHSILDLDKYLSGGVFYVNLWHGVSVKKVRWQAPQYYVKKYHLRNEGEMKTSFWFKMMEYPTLFIKPDLLLAPSEVQAHMFFTQMLDVPLNKILLSVPARSRFLMNDLDYRKDFVEKYEPNDTKQFIEFISNYHKVYIYMPTWRSDQRDFVSDAGIDWLRLEEVLSEKDALLILKMHMFTKIDLSFVAMYKHICVFPNCSDIYTVLPFVDCLITDYSSIYTDFLTMNKETILFVYDYERFTKEGHEVMDYDKYYLGRRAYNFAELLDIIKNNEDCHLPKEQYDFVMNFFWNNNENRPDVAEEIKRRIRRK